MAAPWAASTKEVAQHLPARALLRDRDDFSHLALVREARLELDYFGWPARVCDGRNALQCAGRDGPQRPPYGLDRRCPLRGRSLRPEKGPCRAPALIPAFFVQIGQP